MKMLTLAFVSFKTVNYFNLVSNCYLCLYFTAIGPVPSPFDCYLVNRSLKTLHLRMREHFKSGKTFCMRFFKIICVLFIFGSCTGLAVAQYLETHPCVERVIHPGILSYFTLYLTRKLNFNIFTQGLPSHPQHELFKRQCYGHSGMVTFYIKGGLDESKAFFKSLKVFTLAESLGGYESLAELP